jgi:hypothetical protein
MANFGDFDAARFEALAEQFGNESEPVDAVSVVLMESLAHSLLVTNGKDSEGGPVLIYEVTLGDSAIEVSGKVAVNSTNTLEQASVIFYDASADPVLDLSIKPDGSELPTLLVDSRKILAYADAFDELDMRQGDPVFRRMRELLKKVLHTSIESVFELQGGVGSEVNSGLNFDRKDVRLLTQFVLAQHQTSATRSSTSLVLSDSSIVEIAGNRIEINKKVSKIDFSTFSDCPALEVQVFDHSSGVVYAYTRRMGGMIDLLVSRNSSPEGSTAPDKIKPLVSDFTASSLAALTSYLVTASLESVGY